jgi:uroporphyrinogen III methyltransferase/synthase
VVFFLYLFLDNGEGNSMNAGKKGMVYLIGAGPGDPELLTLKAARILKTADVVLYDRLVDNSILTFASESSLKMCVGKEHGENPNEKQVEINDLMVEFAERGKIVARLKSGDPFVFGRGGEEVDFLVEHGIEVVVIPGLTSAISLPELVGIPVTHRDYSSSITIVSGHRKSGEDTDWNTLAKLNGTIIVLMGMDSIGKISASLMSSGMSRDMPVCIIQNGSRKTERTVLGTLENISRVAVEGGFSSPALIIIGRVASKLASSNAIHGKRMVSSPITVQKKL